MIREKYTNGIESTLNGAINNSTTTVVVTDASSWPSAGFRVRCEDEIMYVTSRSTNTLTVVRGAESSSAASHADTSVINHVLTAGALDRVRIGILADIGIVPYEDSLSADDDEFDDENFSGWTAIAGTPNITQTVEKNHRFSAIIPVSTANAQYYAWGKSKTPSGGDWIQGGFQISGSGSQYPLPTLWMGDGTTYNAGNQIQFGWSPHENALFNRIMTGFNTSVTQNNFSGATNYNNFIHLRFVFESSNHYSGYVSNDGLLWANVFNNSSLGSLGTPSKMGFAFSSWGATREFQFSTSYCRFSF